MGLARTVFLNIGESSTLMNGVTLPVALAVGAPLLCCIVPAL